MMVTIKKFHNLLLESSTQHDKTKDYFENIFDFFIDINYQIKVTNMFTNNTGEKWEDHPHNDYNESYIIEICEIDSFDEENSNDDILNRYIECLKQIKNAIKKLEIDSLKSQIIFDLPNFTIRCIDISKKTSNIDDDLVSFQNFILRNINNSNAAYKVLDINASEEHRNQYRQIVDFIRTDYGLELNTTQISKNQKNTILKDIRSCSGRHHRYGVGYFEYVFTYKINKDNIEIKFDKKIE